MFEVRLVCGLGKTEKMFAIGVAFWKARVCCMLCDRHARVERSN